MGEEIFPLKIQFGIRSVPLLSYSWHVSSRNMFPTIRNLQIRVHVYRPRHCCGDWLTFGFFCSDDCRSWPRDEKINNYGCWGKHAHIPDNDYWGICLLFQVVWTTFVLVQLFLCGTHGIYFNINWTVHMSDNLPERVQILGHAHIICITVRENRIICCQIFCDCS